MSFQHMNVMGAIQYMTITGSTCGVPAIMFKVKVKVKVDSTVARLFITSQTSEEDFTGLLLDTT